MAQMGSPKMKKPHQDGGAGSVPGGALNSPEGEN